MSPVSRHSFLGLLSTGQIFFILKSPPAFRMMPGDGRKRQQAVKDPMSRRRRTPCCHVCGKRDGSDVGGEGWEKVRLKLCSRCRRVSYCTPECQKVWKKEKREQVDELKPMCSAFHLRGLNASLTTWDVCCCALDMMRLGSLLNCEVLCT